MAKYLNDIRIFNNLEAEENITSKSLTITQDASIGGDISITGKINELTLTKQSTGFTITGGDTAKTITITADATIAHSTHAPGSDNQAIASGYGMNFDGGSGNITVSLGTPSSLTAITTNNVSITSHTHEVSATDTGESSSLVKTGTDGSITATNKFNFGDSANIFYNVNSRTLDFVFA